ncbi:hypothetical protein D3C76_1556210 [compost metagenome]
MQAGGLQRFEQTLFGPDPQALPAAQQFQVEGLPRFCGLEGFPVHSRQGPAQGPGLLPDRIEQGLRAAGIDMAAQRAVA